MEADYGAFNRKQQAYAIREIGRVRGEVSELLAEFADSEGKIKRSRMRRILRELDAIEDSLREHGTVALDKIVEDTSEWTSGRVGAQAGLALGSSPVERGNEKDPRSVTTQ